MTLDHFLFISGDLVLVEIIATRGSTPREAGATMLVSRSVLWGTIGGGQLEYAAIDRARAILAGQAEAGMLDFTLGPDSGQCCGGQVSIRLVKAGVQEIAALKSRLAAERLAYPDLFVFGAGHVGRALVRALEPLPFRIVVIETRPDELDLLSPETERRLVPIAEAEIARIRPGGGAVILTHDHALDFLIATEALSRGDLAYVGMIGSKTKRGVFAHHLAREGHDTGLIERLILPIGGSQVRDKRPEVIAALVAAELLEAFLG